MEHQKQYEDGPSSVPSSAPLVPQVLVPGRAWRIAKLSLAALVLIVILIVVGTAGWLYLFPEQVARVALESGRRSSGLVRKEIDLPDGLHYAYLEGGQGEPLMLLHGFGANKDNFVGVAKSLTPHYRVIVPDHIGFGESAHPLEADYTPPAQVERLRALAQALGISRLHLGGSSMGGQIAMTYASLHPAEVASLWLLNPAGAWSAPTSTLQKLISETGRNPLMARTDDEFAQIIAFVMSKPPHIPRPILGVLAKERIQNFRLEERIFPQLLAYSVEERIVGLKTPTLIVWGDQDRTLHAATPEILHKLMPRSQVIIMSGVGHLPMIERAEQSAEDYLRFRGSLRDL